MLGACVDVGVSGEKGVTEKSGAQYTRYLIDIQPRSNTKKVKKGRNYSNDWGQERGKKAGAEHNGPAHFL